MLAFLFSNIRSLPVVKAGKVDKLCEEKTHLFKTVPSKIIVDGVKVDVSDDLNMIVCGNSMKNYNIFDGQLIYVRALTTTEKNSIANYPVLVFNINDPKKNDAVYKLRKFVCYVTSPDWESIYDKYSNRIKISKDLFIAQCTTKYSKLGVDECNNAILSETYDEDNKTIAYSLYPADSVFGKVEYAM